MENLTDKHYKIITYGCQMNENDSEKISGMLRQLGAEKTEDLNECDIIVMNTCSVRENADDRFFGNLGELKALKNKNPELIIAVCGCMMQQEHIIKKINEKYPAVDIIFGTHNIHKFPELLTDYMDHRSRVQDIVADSSYIPEDMPVERLYNHKAYVSITFGCDNFCTYCIVPYTRGREKSREPENIISEIKKAVAGGSKEIMLLGQNVNSYGKGLAEKQSFAQLLEKCAEIEGVERLRFMTSHPKDFSDDIIEVINAHDNICNSIHLPVQSGSDRILKLMNRKYTKDYYKALVSRIRDRIDGVTISTDIIVGFPGETEADFEETLDIVRYSRFDSAFTFIYSPREETRAALMPQTCDGAVIKARFSRLLDLQHEIMTENAVKYKDKTLEVLADGVSKSNNDTMTGRTKNNMLVNFSGKCNTGDTVNVKITQPNTFYLYGEML